MNYRREKVSSLHISSNESISLLSKSRVPIPTHLNAVPMINPPKGKKKKHHRYASQTPISMHVPIQTFIRVYSSQNTRRFFSTCIHSSPQLVKAYPCHLIPFSVSYFSVHQYSWQVWCAGPQHVRYSPKPPPVAPVDKGVLLSPGP